jgi:hypothetical protein
MDMAALLGFPRRLRRSPDVAEASLRRFADDTHFWILLRPKPSNALSIVADAVKFENLMNSFGELNP